MLREFLKDLPQTQETVNELNREIERGEQIIRFNVNLLRDKLLSSLDKQKAEDSIIFEEEFKKDVEKVRNEIGTILFNSK